MQKYIVSCEFIRPYLQAKFGSEAQASLKVKSGTKAKVEDDDSWKKFLYKDKKGIYIPSEHIRGSLVEAGKGVKMKPYGSFKVIVQSYFLVNPFEIYLGKQEPDSIKESFPARKDGQRVHLLHPVISAGTKFQFELEIANDEIDQKTIALIIEKAGLEKGLGAWRAGGHGRFKVLEISKV